MPAGYTKKKEVIAMFAVYIIMALVIIGLPVLLGRISGKSPMEIFFGRRVNDSAFGGDNASAKGTDGAAKKEAAQNGGKLSPARNSTRQELLSFISELVSYSRRNHFYSLVPGTLELEGEVTSFAAVIVSRNAVLGFNCFGYGGDLFCAKDQEKWKQQAGGKESLIESPVRKNMRQQELLEKALELCGFPDVSCQVYGVFTAPSASLKNRGGTNCYTKEEMMNLLAKNEFIKDKGVEPVRIGRALSGLLKKA